MDNVEKATELAHNYKRALAYWDSASELTYEHCREAIRLAGNPVPESEIRQQWEMSKMTLQGTESLRQTYREVWQKGTGSLNTDRKFTGQRLDGTGLHYYGARYHDPEIGRFRSAGTIVPKRTYPQAWNKYSYVLNNPLRYRDSKGRFGETVADTLLVE